jgi:hypothetical protein
VLGVADDGGELVRGGQAGLQLGRQALVGGVGADGHRGGDATQRVLDGDVVAVGDEQDADGGLITGSFWNSCAVSGPENGPPIRSSRST